MELIVFRKKLKELHEKSGMDEFIDWPFVYDIDEKGKIYIDEAGSFWFSDNCYNWVESHLNLGDVVNLRYVKCHEEGGIDNVDEYEVSESNIYIHFSSGESIWLWNRHETFSVEIYVNLERNEYNSKIIEDIQKLSATQMRISVK